MIIEIEYWKEDRLLVGKEISFESLRVAVAEMLEKNGEDGFIPAFCSRFGYHELPYVEGYTDYIIDLDTHLVLVTGRSFPKELDGAKVLYYTDKSDFAPVYYQGGEVSDRVFYLAVCQYHNDNSFYIFHLDESLKVVADACLNSIDDCKKYMNEYDVKWHEYK